MPGRWGHPCAIVSSNGPGQREGRVLTATRSVPEWPTARGHRWHLVLGDRLGSRCEQRLKLGILLPQLSSVLGPWCLHAKCDSAQCQSCERGRDHTRFREVGGGNRLRSQGVTHKPPGSPDLPQCDQKFSQIPSVPSTYRELGGRYRLSGRVGDIVSQCFRGQAGAASSGTAVQRPWGSTSPVQQAEVGEVA